MNTPTPTSTPATDPIQSARQLLKELQEEFAVFRDAAPLAIGIDKQILAQRPDTNRKILRIALGMHTKSTRYLKKTEGATVRLNLDGSPAGELDQAHRERANTMVRERHKRMIEQKKAQREAEEAERKRAEKLNQLAQKFSRSSK